MTSRFDLIGMVVDDMATTLAFYRRLGLTIPADADGQPHVEAQLPGGTRIAWDTVATVRPFDPDWTPPQGGGHRLGLAFLCDGLGEVDALYGELTRDGYAGHKAPWDAPWGERYAVLHDPDGNAVDLFAPLDAVAT